MPTNRRFGLTNYARAGFVWAGLLAMIAGAGCNEGAKQAAQGGGGAPNQQAPPAQPMLPANAPSGVAMSTPVAAAAPQRAAPAGSTATPAAKPVVSAPPVNDSMPTIPPGSRWTIFCYTVKDDPTSPVRGAHVAGAKESRDRLRASTRKSDWYVLHGSDSSNIYFGFYKSVEPGDAANAAEVKRAHDDLQWVRQVKSATGDRPFERSLFVALDAPDPTAPPEWNLFNVDRDMNPSDEKRAFWSLQVMAFRGHPLRKEAAVQAVADLRAKNIEAYYYHGDAVSSVTVGRWPYSAVKPQNRTDEMKDVAHAAVGTPIVVSSIPISEQLSAKPIDGKSAVSVAPKLEVQDPQMLRVMKQFPTHAVNYEIGIQRTKDGKEVEDPSFLVEIPRARGNGKFDDPAANAPVAAERVPNGWGSRRGNSMVPSEDPRRRN